MIILYFHFNILHSRLILLLNDLILNIKRLLSLSITFNFIIYAFMFVSKYFFYHRLSIYYLLSVYYVLLFVFCFYVICTIHLCYLDFIYYKIYLCCIFCSFKITPIVFICIVCKFHSFILLYMSSN